MITFVQTLMSGLSLGSIYALIALGYTMVYGIAKMLNFAHGDIIMVGAYAVIVSSDTSEPARPSSAVLDCGCSMCRRWASPLNAWPTSPCGRPGLWRCLITAIGVSYLLQNMALLIFGSEQKRTFRTDLDLPALKLGRRHDRRHYPGHAGCDRSHHDRADRCSSIRPKHWQGDARRLRGLATRPS